MKQDFSIIHLACSQCTKKTHCEQCNQELADSVRRIPGVESAEARIREEKLTVSFSGLSEDELIDRLEAIGLMID